MAKADVKRLVAETNPDFFWLVKKESVDCQLPQKALILLAVRNQLAPEYPLESLFEDDLELIQRAKNYMKTKQEV